MSSDNSTTSNDSSYSDVFNPLQIVILSLTIVLAIFYTVLISVRPAFRHNKLNWFTVNLCLASVLLSIVQLLMLIKRMASISSESFPCRLQGFLVSVCTCHLMYSHVVIGASRYLTIVYASKPVFRTTRFTLVCLACGWLVAIAVAVPFLAIDSFACSSRNMFLSYYSLSVTLIVPALLVLLLNIRIFSFVRRSSRRVHGEGSGTGVSHSRDVQLLKTMIVTYTVFVVGWIPLFLTQTFAEAFPIPKVIDGIFQILPEMSMLCDVTLLIVINQPVRLFLLQTIRRQEAVQLDRTAVKTKAR